MVLKNTFYNYLIARRAKGGRNDTYCKKAPVISDGSLPVLSSPLCFLGALEINNDGRALILEAQQTYHSDREN